MADNHNYNNSNDEITLKELILKIQEFWKEIWKYKWWIILAGILLAVLMAFKASKEDITYSAHLTFMVNDDEGGGVNGISAILGSFGLGGGGGKSKHNLDKILQLSKTRKISQNAFFNKVEIDGKYDYLANHIVAYKESIGQWGSKPFYNFWDDPSPLKGFRFTTDSIKHFKELDFYGLSGVHSSIIGGKSRPGLVSSGYEEETGIMHLTATTQNPNLSIFLAKDMYTALTEYYISKSVEKQKFTFDLVKLKVDSIELDLRYNESALANLKDTQRSKFLKKDQLKELRLEGKIRMGYAALAKAKENLEIADFSLKNKTPFIQVIDEPMHPIMPKVPSVFKSLILGGVIGSIVAILFFLGRKIIRDSLSN